MGYQLTQSGYVRDWQTVRRLVTTRLPLEDRRVIEIRKPCLPDAEQAQVYSWASTADRTSGSPKNFR